MRHRVIMNGSTENEEIPKLAPPAILKGEIREKAKLVVETLWMHIVLIPAILIALYKKVFPKPGKSLRGKVVLVSGAGRGLGRALAVKFAKEGCKVACVDVDKNTVAETAEIIKRDGNEASSYITNIARPEEVRKLADDVTKDFGPLDILVNNAGIIAGHTITNAKDSEILGIVNVNFLSHFWMIRAFLPSMQQRNSGHIVAMSSLSAFTGLGFATTYASCKWAITGLMESLREELRSSPSNNIQLTTVHPYYVNTSSEYTDRWKIRLPELTIEDVVEPTIEAIKQNQTTVSIPEKMYYAIHLVKLLPQQIMDMFKDVMYTKITPPLPEDWEKFPAYSIIANTVATKTDVL